MIMSSLSKVWIFTVYALLGAPRSLRRRSQLLPLPALPTLLPPPFLPLFLEFLLQVFEGHVQGVHQIMGFFHNDESPPLRLDMDLGLVAVFLHGEDEVDLDDRSQQLFERLEPFLTVGLDLGREVHLPSREMHDHELPSMANLLFRIWDGGS